MIARLRHRHRTTVSILFVLVVVLFAWAVIVRQATPRVDQPPGAATASHGTERVIP